MPDIFIVPSVRSVSILAGVRNLSLADPIPNSASVHARSFRQLRHRDTWPTGNGCNHPLNVRLRVSSHERFDCGDDVGGGLHFLRPFKMRFCTYCSIAISMCLDSVNLLPLFPDTDLSVSIRLLSTRPEMIDLLVCVACFAFMGAYCIATAIQCQQRISEIVGFFI